MDITMLAILKKLAGGGGASAAVEIDNKTIVKGSDGKLKTAVGGYETVDFDITWDGDTTGKTFVELGPKKCYHVSDEFFTKEQLIGATVEITQGSEKQSMTITGDAVQEGNGVVTVQVGIISVPAPTTINGIAFEKKGVYFLAGNNNFISRLFAVTVEKIPEKFIDQTLLEQKVDDVRAAANAAQTTAETAQTTANAAQTTANAAQTTAETALPLAGGIMTGTLNMNENNILLFKGSYTDFVKVAAYKDNTQYYMYLCGNGVTNFTVILGSTGSTGFALVCNSNEPSLSHLQIPKDILSIDCPQHMGGGEGIGVLKCGSVYLRSPSGKYFNVTVSDDGKLTATEVT